MNDICNTNRRHISPGVKVLLCVDRYDCVLMYVRMLHSYTHTYNHTMYDCMYVCMNVVITYICMYVCI